MKKRWIDKDGNFWNGVSIVIDDVRIWNPSEEQLIEAGYTEWIEPTPPEPTAEELLERAKMNKIAEIDNYDHSDSVNCFYLNNNEMWLTVEERQLIATLISANEAIGRETMTRWFGGNEYTFPISTWKQMLVALEVYAGDAINVTESHKAAINAMNSIELIINYDITAGYPLKLSF